MSADLSQPSFAPERELEIRLEQQELVAAFGLYALRASELDKIFDQSCEIAARGLETKFAKVLEYRAEGPDFLLRNGVGWHPGVVGHATIAADMASPAGFALQTKMPVISNHLGSESRFRTPAVLAAHGIERAINVIIANDAGVPFGVLEVDSTDRLRFTSHDVSFLQALANILAAAIDRQMQLKVQESLLRDKDILIQEVHHRIKNSLQLVQTMLSLQARIVTDPGEQSRLNDAASRVLSIAAVHERLYEEGAVEQVDLAPYLSGLLTKIATSLGSGAAPSIDVDPMVLPPEHATAVGLIAVELVTNALKYGTPPIEISVRQTPGGAMIECRDAGPGFPADFEPQSRASLGMRLIAAMARTPRAITIDRSQPNAYIRVQVTFQSITR